MRRVPISAALRGWLEHHPSTDPEAVLFPNPNTGRRWSHWVLRDTWLAACRRVGAKAGLYEGTKHTFATNAKRRGVDDRSLQAVLGHAEARSTERYARLSAEHLRNVVDVP